MFGIEATVLAFIVLAAASAGAVAYAFLFNTMANERRRQASRDGQEGRNRPSVVKASRDRSPRQPSAENRCRIPEGARRKQKGKNRNVKKPPLKVQIRQAGMQVEHRGFYINPSFAASA